MSSQELRHLVGSTVTLETGDGDVHGRLLSCNTNSVWVVDDGESDVIVPLVDVLSVHADADAALLDQLPLV